MTFSCSAHHWPFMSFAIKNWYLRGVGKQIHVACWRVLWDNTLPFVPPLICHFNNSIYSEPLIRSLLAKLQWVSAWVNVTRTELKTKNKTEQYVQSHSNTFLEDNNYYIVNPWNLKIRTLPCDKVLFTIRMYVCWRRISYVYIIQHISWV